MEDLKLGAIFPALLFFALIVGIIIIFREEIEKMELFGKLHTSPVPETLLHGAQGGLPDPLEEVSSDSAVSSGLDISPNLAVSPPLVSLFSGPHPISFGSGRLVDSGAQVATVNSLSEGYALHTVPPDVDNYFVRAFVEESASLYEPSPYAGSVVFLDRVSNVKQSDPNKEYFALLASGLLDESITITDWKVTDRYRKTVHTLPKGIKILGSPDVGHLSLPIDVRSGDVIVVSSGQSPAGDSFRVNRCSGYRTQFEQAVPTIKTQCPEPSEEFLDDGTVPFSDDGCFEAVSSLPPCTELSEIPHGVSIECRNFFKNTLTESGCVSRHKNDADFFTPPEWRIFLNSKEELWRNRDNVLYLLDQNNLLVATLVYQ